MSAPLTLDAAALYALRDALYALVLAADDVLTRLDRHPHHEPGDTHAVEALMRATIALRDVCQTAGVI